MIKGGINMRNKLLLTALAAFVLAFSSCGSTDDTKPIGNTAAAKDTVSPAADMESGIDEGSIADTSSEEEKITTAAETTAVQATTTETSSDETKDVNAVEEPENPHMSNEPTGENSLAVNEGGCKNPDEPSVIHYINNEDDIDIVKEIVCRAAEFEEVPDDYVNVFRGGVHPEFSFEKDGASYEVKMNPAGGANIEINGKYYWLGDEDMIALTKLVYYKQGEDDEVYLHEQTDGKDGIITYYYYDENGEKVTMEY